MKIFHTIINFQDKSTLTPLSAACVSGRVEIVKLLLEAGANRWALIDNRNSGNFSNYYYVKILILYYFCYLDEIDIIFIYTN